MGLAHFSRLVVFIYIREQCVQHWVNKNLSDCCASEETFSINPHSSNYTHQNHRYRLLAIHEAVQAHYMDG